MSGPLVPPTPEPSPEFKPWRYRSETRGNPLDSVTLREGRSPFYSMSTPGPWKLLSMSLCGRLSTTMPSPLSMGWFSLGPIAELNLRTP